MFRIVLSLIPSKVAICMGGTINVYVIPEGPITHGLADLVKPTEAELVLIREEIGRQHVVNAKIPEQVYRIEPITEEAFKRYEANSHHCLRNIDGLPVVFV